VPPLASFFLDFASTAGGLAAAIAVIGFLFQAVSVFREDDEVRVRRAAAAGGLFGLVIGIGVLVSSATL
jgi:uncharacterized membrane protein YjfL (UPF0719 family)